MSDKEFVTVDPVTIIIKECINLSTAMRKYSKFTSQSGVAALLGGGTIDNKLINLVSKKSFKGKEKRRKDE